MSERSLRWSLCCSRGGCGWWRVWWGPPYTPPRLCTPAVGDRPGTVPAARSPPRCCGTSSYKKIAIKSHFKYLVVVDKQFSFIIIIKDWEFSKSTCVFNIDNLLKSEPIKNTASIWVLWSINKFLHKMSSTWLLYIFSESPLLFP